MHLLQWHDMKKKTPLPPEPAARVPLAVRAVYVRKSSLVIGEGFDPLVAGQRLNGTFTFNPDGYAVSEMPAGEGQPDVTSSITFNNQFNFVFHLGNPQDQSAPLSTDQQKIAATISACISVNYLLTGDRPEPEELEKYISNSLVQAWPYWREYCHSSMLRMQLPVVMAPLLLLTQQKVPLSAPSLPD